MTTTLTLPTTTYQPLIRWRCLYEAISSAVADVTVLTKGRTLATISELAAERVIRASTFPDT
jgi:hypothetical protein